MSNIGNYNAWSPQSAATERSEAATENAGNYIKLNEGDTVVRILPPAAGEDSPFVRTQLHYLKDDEDKLHVFECPSRGKARADRKPCPACEEGARLSASPNPADKEAAKNFWPSRRVFCAAIDRADEDAGPKVLQMGTMIYDQLLAIASDPRKGGDFSHPIKGFDVIIERTGSGQFDTRYKVTGARENTPMLDDEDEIIEFLEDRPEISSSITLLLTDDIQALVDDIGGAAALPPPRNVTSGGGRRTRRASRSVDNDFDSTDLPE